LRIAGSGGAAARGVNGRDRDGDEFIGFLHEQLSLGPLFHFIWIHELSLSWRRSGAGALAAFSSCNPHSAIINPQSEVRNPQWAAMGLASKSA
jgi:hypothetical protein